MVNGKTPYSSSLHLQQIDVKTTEDDSYDSTEPESDMVSNDQSQSTRMSSVEAKNGTSVTINLNSVEDQGITQPDDMLLPTLTTPRIIEIDELMKVTQAELEDVQEHIVNAESLELGVTKIRALQLMKAGLEVELKRLERDREVCKERDLENLILPVC
ncbi:hypothetical protein BC830DRAFT_1087899 [Chytriomyces sp. MP71]|nr:hypothetical protein BC830DRAFT_1087899 [Chytriomyces sp. MP71]